MSEWFDICMACLFYQPVPPDFTRVSCGWCEKQERYVQGLKEPSHYDCEAFKGQRPCRISREPRGASGQ